MRYREASFVVPQVVARAVPLVVPPGRHVSGRPAPHHHVFEVAVDRGLAVVVPVCQITRDENEGRLVGGDRSLGRADPLGVPCVSYVGLDVEAEAPDRSGDKSVIPLPAD